MTRSRTSASEKTWSVIEIEKRRDRIMRRICIGAWAVTLLIVLVFAVIVGMQMAETMRRVAVGIVPGREVMQSAMPLVIALGLFSLMVATLTTSASFCDFVARAGRRSSCGWRPWRT
jgi:hypothetical protein